MNIQTFITNYQEAFGKGAELPIVFWYSNRQEAPEQKINGCLFKCLKQVRAGEIISLSTETITCGGGKFYTGFTEMPERVPGFVSLKEKYKKTPEMVLDAIDELQVPRTEQAYLHFARIDKITSLESAEGILFLATPDMLSGLATWAYFDNNAWDAVSAPFGSGCCSVITQAVLENRKQGRRTFLGFFDPSVRPYFEADLLSFTIPMSRFKEMYETMRESCLFDTHAWGKIKERLLCVQSREHSGRPAPTPVSFSLYPDITLREVVLKDAAAIYQAIDTHRDYLREWLPFVDNMRSVADEESFLKSVLLVPADRYQPIFGIWNDRNEICGLIGFHFSDFANHRTEIGYWLLPEYQHRGIITAGVRTLCRWAMTEKGIKRIQIRCAAGNVASNAIPLRLGFHHEGIERAGELLSSGEYTDVNVYSILKEEVLNEHNKQEYPPMHTTEHIVNQTMIRLFHCGRSISAHIERKKSKLDYRLAACPSEEEVKKLEEAVNAVIAQHLPVTTAFITQAEAKGRFDLERLPEDATETVRVVKVGDYDECLCLGTHVGNTSEIGTFKIISHDWDEDAKRWRMRFKLI